MPHKHFNIRSLFAVILGWLFVCIYDLTYMILTFATLGLLSRRIFHYAAHGWGKTLLLLAGVELETEGLEHLNSDNGKIAIFNHQSLLDVLWLAALFPARGVAIVKKEFAYIPLVNLTFWSAGFVFIDRSNRQKALNALKSLATKIISERSTLFIAPEGTRSQSGEILPFKKGPFHIALDGNIPIVPLVVHGPHHLLPK